MVLSEKRPTHITTSRAVLRQVRTTWELQIAKAQQPTKPFEEIFMKNLREEIIFARAQVAQKDKVNASSLALEIPFSSCAMAARIALAMYESTDSTHFYSDLFECIKPLLLKPEHFTASMRNEKSKTIRFTNHKNMGVCVVESVPVCGQVITEVHTKYSDFRDKVIRICKFYLSCNLNRKQPDKFAKALEACVREFGVTM